MKVSAKLFLKRDKQKMDGTYPLYISCYIEGKTKRFPLNLSWKAEFYDFEKNTLKKNKENEALFNDYNIIIKAEIGKINDIFVRYRLTEKPLTVELLEKEYFNYNSRLSFLAYYEDKMKEAYKRKKMAEQTFKNHKSTLLKLTDFQKEVSFGDLNPKFLAKFEDHLLRSGLKVNGVWGVFKSLRMYIRMAYEDGKLMENPLLKHSVKQEDTRPVFLTLDELRLLEQYYFGKIEENEVRVLRPFLFSCATGLRISDLKRIEYKHITTNSLCFRPHKTERFGKDLTIPLIQRARKHLIENGKGLVFGDMMAEQPANRLLKKIAAKVGISKLISHHTGRHTFAVTFLEAGGSVEVLQKLLGHSKIQTTMVYVHVTDERINKQMLLMDNLV